MWLWDDFAAHYDLLLILLQINMSHQNVSHSCCQSPWLGVYIRTLLFPWCYIWVESRHPSTTNHHRLSLCSYGGLNFIIHFCELLSTFYGDFTIYGRKNPLCFFKSSVTTYSLIIVPCACTSFVVYTFLPRITPWNSPNVCVSVNCLLVDCEKLHPHTTII